MAARLAPGDTVVFVGDSITAAGWYAEAGGLLGQLGSIGDSLTVVNSGVGGNKVADILADVAARITDYSPDVVVIEVGVNDATGATDPGDFRDDYDAILAAIAAANPATRVVCVSILCNGELWSSVGPAFAGNATDTEITALNAEIAGAASAAGQTYADIRTPAALYESQVNTPEPGSTPSFLTGDNIHPNATGELLMGTWTLPYFALAIGDQPASFGFMPGKPRYIFGASMGADVVGDWLDVSGVDNLSFHATWFGDPTGTFTIEASNDGPALDASTRADAPAGRLAPATISTVASGNPAGVGGQLITRLTKRAERWVRLMYERTSGDGSLYVAFSGKKAHP